MSNDTKRRWSRTVGKRWIEHPMAAHLAHEMIERADKLMGDVVDLEVERIDGVAKAAEAERNIKVVLTDPRSTSPVDEAALRRGRKAAAGLLRAAAALLEES